MRLTEEEARRFRRGCAGTEHLLIALANEDANVALLVLQHFRLDQRKIRSEVERLIPPLPDSASIDAVTLSPGAKNSVNFAEDEARNLGHNYVGTEHLLMGVAREKEGLAAQVLTNLGLNPDDLHAAVVDFLRGRGPWQRS